MKSDFRPVNKTLRRGRFPDYFTGNPRLPAQVSGILHVKIMGVFVTCRNHVKTILLQIGTTFVNETSRGFRKIV
jgi:hypothetical protein